MRQHIAYDIRNGVLRIWWKYVVVAAVFVLDCLVEEGDLRGWQSYGLTDLPSLGNYLARWFAGVEILQEEEGVRQVTIPLEWVVVQAGSLFTLIGYAGEDRKENGYRLALLSGSRTVWWDGKYFRVLVSMLFYYGVLFGVLCLAAAAHGGLSLSPASEVWLSGITFQNGIQCLCFTLGLSLLVSFTFGVLLTVIEVMVSAPAALIVVLGYSIASVYWCSGFLVGNYSMLLRNNALGWEGVCWQEGVAVCGLLCLAAYAAGRRYLNKMEF